MEGTSLVTTLGPMLAKSDGDKLVDKVGDKLDSMLGDADDSVAVKISDNKNKTNTNKCEYPALIWK